MLHSTVCVYDLFLNHPSHHLIEFIPSKQNIFEVNTEKKLLEISVFEFEFSLSLFFLNCVLVQFWACPNNYFWFSSLSLNPLCMLHQFLGFPLHKNVIFLKIKSNHFNFILCCACFKILKIKFSHPTTKLKLFFFLQVLGAIVLTQNNLYYLYTFFMPYNPSFAFSFIPFMYPSFLLPAHSLFFSSPSPLSS